MHSPPWKLSLYPCPAWELMKSKFRMFVICWKWFNTPILPHPSLSGQETEKELDLPQATQLVQSSLL